MRPRRPRSRTTVSTPGPPAPRRASRPGADDRFEDGRRRPWHRSRRRPARRCPRLRRESGDDHARPCGGSRSAWRSGLASARARAASSALAQEWTIYLHGHAVPRDGELLRRGAALDLLPGRREPVRLRGRLRPRATGSSAAGRRSRPRPVRWSGCPRRCRGCTGGSWISRPSVSTTRSPSSGSRPARTPGGRRRPSRRPAGSAGGDPSQRAEAELARRAATRCRRVPAEPDPGHAVRHPADASTASARCSTRPRRTRRAERQRFYFFQQVETSEAVREVMVQSRGPELHGPDRAGSARRGRAGVRPAPPRAPGGGRDAVGRRPARGAGRRESLRGAGFEPVVLEVPEGEEAKSLREAERLWDGFLGGRPRSRLAGRRGGRRRRGRPGRLRRRHVHARRAGGPGADDPAGAGGRLHRRQGGGQPSRGART